MRRDVAMILADKNFLWRHSRAEGAPAHRAGLFTEQAKLLQLGLGRRCAQAAVFALAMAPKLEHVAQHGDPLAAARNFAQRA